jgi:hypothetical protein
VPKWCEQYEGVLMKIVFLIIFAAAMAIIVLNGCSTREEHGLPLRWSNG